MSKVWKEDRCGGDSNGSRDGIGVCIIWDDYE